MVFMNIRSDVELCESRCTVYHICLTENESWTFVKCLEFRGMRQKVGESQLKRQTLEQSTYTNSKQNGD